MKTHHGLVAFSLFILLACGGSQTQAPPPPKVDEQADSMATPSDHTATALDTLTVKEEAREEVQPEALHSAPAPRMAPQATPVRAEDAGAPPPPPPPPAEESSSPETMAIPDSVGEQNELPQTKKQATLGYAYPSKMTRGESSDFNVFVSLVHAESKVLDTLKTIVARQVAHTKNEKIKQVIETTNILLYRKLKVELLDPDKAFEITAVHDNNEQEVDEQGDNKWRWNVKPLTNQADARLILKIIAQRPNGNSEPIVDETINIKINVDESQFFRDMWLYILDHYAWFLTAILIPSIAFLAKWWFGRKKEKEPEGGA